MIDSDELSLAVEIVQGAIVDEATNQILRDGLGSTMLTELANECQAYLTRDVSIPVPPMPLFGQLYIPSADDKTSYLWVVRILDPIAERATGVPSQFARGSAVYDLISEWQDHSQSLHAITDGTWKDSIRDNNRVTAWKLLNRQAYLDLWKDLHHLLGQQWPPFVAWCHARGAPAGDPV